MDLNYTPSLDEIQILCVNITIFDDITLENEEEFTVSIDSVDSNITTGSSSAVLITDNDG